MTSEGVGFSTKAVYGGEKPDKGRLRRHNSRHKTSTKQNLTISVFLPIRMQI